MCAPNFVPKNKKYSLIRVTMQHLINLQLLSNRQSATWSKQTSSSQYTVIFTLAIFLTFWGTTFTSRHTLASCKIWEHLRKSLMRWLRKSGTQIHGLSVQTECRHHSSVVSINWCWCGWLSVKFTQWSDQISSTQALSLSLRETIPSWEQPDSFTFGFWVRQINCGPVCTCF